MPVESCAGNDQIDGFDLIVGKMEKRAPVASGTAGACSVASSSNIADSIADRLTGIAAKMSVGGAQLLSADDREFLSRAPFPLYNLLRDATAQQTVPETIDALVLPLSTAYAARMFDDLHKMTRLVLSKAREVHELQRYSAGIPQKCNVAHIAGAYGRVAAMEERSLRYREMAKANYAAQVADLSTNIALAHEMLSQRQRDLQMKTSASK